MDRRTSARDLLTLSQKVSTLLQRQSDKLLGEIEDARGSLTPDEEAQRSEQCQQAINLRRNVWETSKLLKSALDHVEEIDDEDEARILREPMDDLQVHVKKALQMVSSPADSKTSKVSGTLPSSSSTASSTTPTDYPTKALPIPAGFADRSAAGTSIPSGTPPGLSGSLNRHPLGLFSTSPNFGAQSPFASPKRLSAARFPPTPIAAASDSEAEVEVHKETKATAPPVPAAMLSDPLLKALSTSNNSNGYGKSSSTKEIIPTMKSRPGTTHGLSTISLDDGPLSIATTPVPPPVKSTAKNIRANAGLNSATTSSSLSSLASFSTAISSPLDTPISPPTNPSNKSSMIQSTSKQVAATLENKSALPECKVSKSPEAARGPIPVRRVPRGLFSSPSTTSTSRAEPSSGSSGFGPLSGSDTISGNGHSNGNGTVGHTLGKTPVASMDQIVTTLTQESLDSPTRGRTPTRALSPGFLSASRPHTPPTSSTPTNGPRSPTSPRLLRSQPKPSPIQTAPTSPVTDQFSKNGEEQMSRLAKDLERAMNPTPTDPVPQPYFLQGKGLLERIPNQDSMNDGDDHDDQYSEDSDRDDGQSGQDGAPGLSRGSGSLRRQKSGGKRRFRISRSRSRNRSKGRQERIKVDLPIEIGYTSALASSDWPFDKAPTPPPSQSSLSALQQQQLQRQRNASLAGSSRQQQQLQQQGAHQRSASQPTSSLYQPLRAGPRLPFAESVTVSNPIRVGRGMGSFTVYNVSLTLCDPAKAKVPLPPRQSQNQNQFRNEGEGSSSSTTQDERTSSALHAGHADVQRSKVLFNNNLNSPPTATTITGDSNDTSMGASLRPPPSKAALMMTRSLSFPVLGDSAERLLREMRSIEEDDDSGPTPLPWRPQMTTAAPLATRPSSASTDIGFSLPPLMRPQSAPIPSPPLPLRGSERVVVHGGRAMQGLDATISRATSAQQVTAAHGHGYVSPPIPTRVVTGFTPAAQSSSSSTPGPGRNSAQAPPRVIHVRKRYTDFVTLRAQLVETFREPRKGGIRNARQLFSKSSSSSVVSSIHASPGGGNPVSGGHRVSPFMSNDEDEDYHDEDDDEDDDENGIGYSAHSRMASSTSMTSTASSQQSSGSRGSLTRGMPKLPPKKVVGKFRPVFVEKRRRELEYFLEWVVAHPIIGDSPVVVQWFLGPTPSPTL
ncbi:hypothetical protein BGZ96_009858 [Linnemannia gamsii]|uniref:PX domain-containing protein n=1 Tax=Linnemannia gamsii TaxID=64522 RepID=A0ABQ7JVM6_9FUNG|nr:hypothetical protein BGZ96_009858 [Linnemannia gamsii]